MRRVLVYWTVGDILTRYTFISKIPDNYPIPKFTDASYFLEGRIIDGFDGNMEDYIIELVLRNELISHSWGREFKELDK